MANFPTCLRDVRRGFRGVGVLEVFYARVPGQDARSQCFAANQGGDSVATWEKVSEELKKRAHHKIHMSINCDVEGGWRVLFRHKTSCRSWEAYGPDLDKAMETAFTNFVQEDV